MGKAQGPVDEEMETKKAHQTTNILHCRIGYERRYGEEQHRCELRTRVVSGCHQHAAAKKT